DYDAEVADGGETGLMASADQSDAVAAAAAKATGEKSAKTSTQLDDAMGAVADAVKSAAQAMERETADSDEDPD
ncbi:MAG: hypothetical protein KAR80_08550, partial [Rhodospirillaceae bacterium]|nr:hypothetical protein [Rhodospirillaceae bacterium]